jgi:shikimate kinase
MGMTDHRPVAVIVGAPGAGKTTVGRLLAERLGVDFVDTDVLIASRAGKAISDIFIEDGENAFREMEREAVMSTLASADGVVSLGGGAVVDEHVRKTLDDCRVIWLQVSANQATARVGLTGSRPLLLGNVRGTLITLLEQRTPLYEEVGDFMINTDDRTVEDIVSDIVSLVVKP